MKLAPRLNLLKTEIAIFKNDAKPCKSQKRCLLCFFQSMTYYPRQHNKTYTWSKQNIAYFFKI